MIYSSENRQNRIQSKSDLLLYLNQYKSYFVRVIGNFVNIIVNIFRKVVIRLLKWKGRNFSFKQIQSRYPSIRNLIPELFNYMFAFMGSIYSFRPVVMAIEPLNICNLSCLQCEVNRKMKRAKGAMEFDLLKKIIDENNFFFRVNLTNYGEPLLHRDILKFISYIHNKEKICTIFTNGTLLYDEMIIGLIDSGLDVITFSIDGIGEVYEKVRGWKYDDVENKIKRFLQVNKQKGNPIWTEMNMVEFESTSEQWLKLLEAWQDRVNIMIKTPLMRSGKRKRRCFNLWRSLVILWDGIVVPCCVDREAEMKLGNIRENNLLEIFNGEAMRKLRKKHTRGEFPQICATCNEFFG